MRGAGRTEPTPPSDPFRSGRCSSCLRLAVSLLFTALLPALLLTPPAIAEGPAPAEQSPAAAEVSAGSAEDNPAETTRRDGLLLTGTLVDRADPRFGTRGLADMDPLPGVLVELLPVLDPYETARTRLEGETVQPVASTRSDTEGRYRLTAPGPGLWTLRFSAPGRLREQVVLAYLPEEMHRPLTVPNRGEIAVRVVDPDGRPVVGAQIVATLAVADRLTGPPGFSEAPEVFGRSGDKGRAVLSARTGAALQLTAFAPGFAPAATVEIETPPTGGSEIRVPLRPGVPRGVRVRDVLGRPVPGAVVSLGEPALPAGRTGDDGTLEILAPVGEALAVRALAPDLRSAQSTLEPLDETSSDSDEPTSDEPTSDEPTSDEPAPEGSASAPPGSNPPPPSGPLVLEMEEPPTLSGQVVEDGSRSPLAGVILWAPQAGESLATSGPRGGYTLQLFDPPQRAFQLLAVRPGYLPQQLTVEPDRNPGPLPTLALRPAAAVTGTVVDPRGRPVSDVDIRVASRTDRRRGGSLSDPHGRFFVAPLEPGGPARLFAEKTGYAPTTVDLPPLEPRRTVEDVTVVLHPGRSAHGRVVTAEEEPVVGAEVRLLSQPQGSSIMERFFHRRLALERAPTTTDGEGDFVVEHLAEGTYDLRVEAPGFAPAEVPGIEVPAGTSPLDLGTVVMEAAVRVEGRVVDPDDRPVAGARVQAFPEGSGMWSGRRGRPFEGVSDVDGRFALGDLHRGDRVTLRVGKPGYAEARVQGVEVPTGEAVEIVLEPAARVSGKVQDPEGRPVEDARVRVELTGGWGWGSSSRELARTDADGRFALDEVPPGDVTLQAQAEGYLRDGLVHLRVEPGARLEDVEITLTPGAAIRGRVVGPGGEPLPEARVSLLQESRGFGPGASAHTDGDGNYRLEGIPPGSRTFIAVHESHPQATRDLEVHAGENRLDFQLTTGQEVSGRVVDALGNPVAAATVWLSGMSRGASRNEVSRSDGSFRFTGVADGSYRLVARHPDHGEAALEEPLEVQGSGRSGLELRFQSAGVIRGRVVGLGLDELAGVEIRALGSEGGNRWARPDFEGRFRIEGLRPGTYRVLAISPGGRQVSEEVELPETAPQADVELEFLSGFTLSGQVLVGSEPLDRGMVTVRQQGGEAGGYNNLDHDGRFRIEGLKEGTYDLQIFDRGGLHHRREVEISGDLDLLIELEAASLAGRVLDGSTGEPLAGVQIEMSAEETDNPLGGLFGAVRTDATGLFRLPRLSAGRYRIAFSKEGYGREERSVDLAPGASDSIEVRLEPSRGLELQLRWTDGLLPASWVQVTASSPEGRPGVSGGFPVGETGTVRLTSLPPGRWEIRVSARGAAVTTVEAVAPGPPVPVTLSPQSGLEITVPELIGDSTVATLEILGPDGRPLPLLGTRSSMVLRSGRASVDQLPAGTWTVRVTAADGRGWSAPATTRPGRTERLVLQ